MGKNNKKRKLNHDSSSGLYNHKERNRPNEEARIDPTYGQRSAIPGLDDNAHLDGDGDDLNYDDDMDALSYLRSVRQEATTIPNLLVAPTQETHGSGECDRSIYESGVGDHRGWYEDGAFVAAPETPAGATSTMYDEDAGETGRDPQMVYFDSILTRFEALRERLNQVPPPEVIASLDEDHPTHLPTNSNKDVFAKWGWRMKTSEPNPAQLACMDKGTVFRLLGMLTKGSMLRRGCQVDSCVSRWLWGLLAKVPDSGELNNFEVSAVRELGKKTVLVGVGFKEAREWGEGMDEVEAGFEGAEEDDVEEIGAIQEEEIPLDYEEEDSLGLGDPPANGHQTPQESFLEEQIIDGEEPVQNAEDVEVNPDLTTDAEENFEAVKARMLAKLDEQTKKGADVGEPEAEEVDETLPTLNTRATLDMIITVAGELYGQRDLLEFREMWSEES